jgi:hypothetical protein
MPPTFCHALPIQIDRFGGKQTAGHYPVTPNDSEDLRKFICFLWGSWLGRKISMMRMPF